MKKKTLILIIFLFAIGFLLFVASPVFAGTEECKTACDTSDCEPGGIMAEVSRECACCGCCQLIDILKIIRGVSKFILQWVGVIALLFFIYGGIMWITAGTVTKVGAGGQKEQINQGKRILVGTIIGILIVFLAWQIVNLVICGLSQGAIAGSCEIFGVKWYKFPQDPDQKCIDARGYCLDDCLNKCYGPGQSCQPGLCGGPAERQCCAPD